MQVVTTTCIRLGYAVVFICAGILIRHSRHKVCRFHARQVLRVQENVVTHQLVK